MKKTLLLTILISTFLLTGCNLPGSSAEPTVDIVATQVAVLLTEGATEPSDSPTGTMAATETVAAGESTITPTVTLTATETPAPDDPAQQLGAPAWTEDFNGSDSPWDFDYEQARFATANGSLNLTTKTNPNWHSWYVSNPKLKNAFVEATIQMTNCSGNDRFGLAVRASSDGQQFYFMGVTCDGQWGFFRMAPDVTIHQILGFQPAAQLSDGTDNPHRIGIWMKGSDFTFYIDGEKVGTATDGALSAEGFTGFLIAYANNAGHTVRVDNLKYWNLP